MNRYILTEAQLYEYVEIKKSEKIFYDILEDLHKNVKFLNENISRQRTSQTIIENYKRKDLLTSRVIEMLIKNKIIDEKHEIIL
jgi:23S rRNA U2552 (ribose-2'-O)-methylase RlmE/FtsJ